MRYMSMKEIIIHSLQPCMREMMSLKPLIFAHSRLTLSARGVPHNPAAIMVRE